VSLTIACDLDGVTIDSPPNPFGSWYYDSECWADLKPMLGAVDTVTQLIEDGHGILFVTARRTSSETRQWLGKWFGGQRWRLIENEPQKWKVKADVYLDDSPNVVTGLWERGLCVCKWVNDRNLNAPARHLVRNWDEFYALVAHNKLDLGHRVVPHKWQRRRERAAMFGDARDVLAPNIGIQRAH
jgi:5' nucleotidase, deoxy (Pyrimidine), cytosolic type C protein (NT5C)